MINKSLPDNSCRTLTDYKHFRPHATGITDPELGIVYFTGPNGKLVATFANYAAHPLTCQTGGEDSLKISSDYPGELRNYVEAALGGLCVFTTGACGDLHPEGYESGFARTREMGVAIGGKIAEHYFDTVRNKDIFEDATPEIKTMTKEVTVNFRESGGREERSSLYQGKDCAKLQLQFLAIGGICLVGVPGELLVEPGLEIKWHSPFRKTFILYNSTAYISYIPHANACLGGGYEAETALLAPEAAFDIVTAAVSGLRELSRK